jgi:hypothetical protein
VAENQNVIIDCPSCKVTVAAPIVAETDGYDEENSIAVRYQFARCPSCSGPLLVERYILVYEEWENLTAPYRIFPPQQKSLSIQVPEVIRESFREAQRCFEASCFTAAAIMCRRVIEEITKTQGVRAKTLLGGLKELRNNDQIDQRLFEWADLLRSIGNEAAHGVGEKIALEDAEDVLHFTEALADYIFVLKTRFESLQKRRASPPPTL